MPTRDGNERTIDPELALFYCGVDVGATATKLVLIDGDKKVLARAVRPSGVDYAATAEACLGQALASSGTVPGNIAYSVATGYGRGNVEFADERKTEIHCHGIGCHHLLPEAITVLDIGGQDNKIVRLEADGRRVDFKMNRKCAAGTGAFLEEIAMRLDLPLTEMDAMAGRGRSSVRLSSFCTVFAKTEILAHLRRGESVEAIVRGAFESVVTRVLEMAPLTGKVVLTGGVVAHNETIGQILAAKLGREVTVAPHPQFTGALGAALMARRQHTGDKAAGDKEASDKAAGDKIAGDKAAGES